MKRIIIPTIGTRGDIQPYIALALGLKSAGYQVVIASHPAMEPLVQSYQLSFRPIGPDIDIGSQAALIRRRSPGWMVGFLRVMRFTYELLEAAHADLLALCRQADLVIVSHTAAGSIEADQLGLPKASVTLIPQAIPVKNDSDPAWKRLLMRAAGSGMGLIMTRPLNTIRHRLGVKPMGPVGITSEVLNLIPISPQVVPPNPLWGSRHQMTGYWFAPTPPTWKPSPEMERFLDSGPAPLVVSLGAMALGDTNQEQTAQIMVAALKESGVRAVIQGWETALQKMAVPAEMLCIGAMPHSWLLDHASGIIHHGGFGTTAAGFRAGIPTLVVPHIIDQFIWGQKVAELGIGPDPIPRKKLSQERLLAAIRQMQSAGMRASAADLGKKIQAEPDGVQKAVDLINKEY
jgi:UDP:flavonoid glycosyltransferase YjiC (YdhE family)